MMKKQGFYWHVHHDILLEYCYDYDGRVWSIKSVKPKNEIETRLRLFKPVKGKLPEEMIKMWEKVKEAERKVTIVRHKWHKAWCDLDKARQTRWRIVKLWKTKLNYRKARKEDLEAWAKHMKALREYLKDVNNNLEQIEALHKKECPNCCWNGGQMVFKENGDDRLK